jgi:hypothetical protein
MGCPDLETLAAFVDGTLTPAERRSVVVHLASCEACYEVVTETLHSEDEATAEEAEPAPAPVVVHPRFRRRAWRLVAAAAAVVVALLPLVLGGGGEWYEVSEGVVVADYSARWGAPEDTFRGAEILPSVSFSDLRLGALLADVQVAVQGGEREAVAERLGVLKGELNESLQVRARGVGRLRETVEAEGLTPTVQQEIGALRDDLAHLSGVELRLGFWAEVSRLAVVSGDEGFIRERRWRRQLREFEDADLPDPFPGFLEGLRRALEEGDAGDVQSQLNRLLRG